MEPIIFGPHQRFKEERERVGISQQALADRLGVSKQTIQNWEKDTPIPSDATKKFLSLGIDPLYVLNGVRLPNLYEVAEEAGEYVIGYSTPHAAKKTLDPAVLAGVMAGVDEYLAEQKLSMPSDKKADLVILLCDFFNAESAKDTPAVKKTTARIIQFGRHK